MGVKIEVTPDGEGAFFYCHGCGRAHVIRVVHNDWSLSHNQFVSAFDGNMESPTFPDNLTFPAEGDFPFCHVRVTSGEIEYLGDCDHALAGTTVTMKDVAEYRKAD